MRTGERRTGRSNMTYRHVTAPTQFVEANGIRFAYRRFGHESGTPLLFMQHFRGGMDHWDPAVTDGFAENRPVILFDNAGVASSSGETPDTIDAMAEHATDFVGALGLSQIDLLGFSIGGYIAQALTVRHPELIRRLILAGTGPRAGEPPQDPKYAEYGSLTDPKTGQAPLEAFLYLFFLDRGVEGPSHSLERPKSGSDQDAPGRSTTTRSHCEDPSHHSDGTHRRAGRSRQGSSIPGLGRFQLCHGHRTFRRWRPRSSLISGRRGADQPAVRPRPSSKV
jgi:pimeloyl-ACP methyl ester carboxylesterase